MSSILTLLLVAFVVLPYLGGSKRKAAAAASQPAPSGNEQEEYLDIVEDAPVQPVVEEVSVAVSTDAEAQVSSVEVLPSAAPSYRFDLRQAVIAQTVLNNDYINELK